MTLLVYCTHVPVVLVSSHLKMFHMEQHTHTQDSPILAITVQFSDLEKYIQAIFFSFDLSFIRLDIKSFWVFILAKVLWSHALNYIIVSHMLTMFTWVGWGHRKWFLFLQAILHFNISVPLISVKSEKSSKKHNRHYFFHLWGCLFSFIFVCLSYKYNKVMLLKSTTNPRFLLTAFNPDWCCTESNPKNSTQPNLLIFPLCH